MHAMIVYRYVLLEYWKSSPSHRLVRGDGGFPIVVAVLPQDGLTRLVPHSVCSFEVVSNNGDIEVVLVHLPQAAELSVYSISR